jgi:hypothetical protein
MPLLKKENGLAKYQGGLLEGTDPHCCCSQFCCEGELQCQNATESFLSDEPCPLFEGEIAVGNTVVSWQWLKSLNPISGEFDRCFFRWDIDAPSTLIGGATGAYDQMEECSDAEGAYTWRSEAIVAPNIPKPPEDRKFNATLPPNDFCDWENAVVTVSQSGRGYLISVSGVANSRFDTVCTNCSALNGAYLVECGDDPLDPPQFP